MNNIINNNFDDINNNEYILELKNNIILQSNKIYKLENIYILELKNNIRLLSDRITKLENDFKYNKLEFKVIKEQLKYHFNIILELQNNKN